MKTLATKTLTLYFIDDFTHYFYRQVENLRDGKLFGAALSLIFTVRIGKMSPVKITHRKT